jgi:putative transposase
MDGKGRWVDNVFIERLWKSVKYEEAYLKAYNSIAEARCELGAYFEFYNQRRRHQGLDNRTPDEVYYSSRPVIQAAAGTRAAYHLKTAPYCLNYPDHLLETFELYRKIIKLSFLRRQESSNFK